MLSSTTTTRSKSKAKDSPTIPPNLPDMYIEITTEDFKKRPERILTSKYLCDSWTTETLYRIPSFAAGTYLMYNLHKNPHYQLPFSERSRLEKRAKEKNVKVTEVATTDFEVPNQLYHYSNETETFKEIVDERKEDFDLPYVIRMLDETGPPSKRGNYAKSVGWRNNSYKFQNTLNIPVRSVITSFDKKILSLMTNIMSLIYEKKLSSIPFAENKRRHDEFSQLLMGYVDEDTDTDDKEWKDEENLFEALTYAMTYCNNDTPNLLNPHIDFQNDRTEHYNTVFSIYYHTYHPDHPNQIVRVVFIGYSRKAIHDYYLREINYKLYKHHLRQYYLCLKIGNQRTFTLPNAFSWDPSLEHKPYMKLPFVDKCGFYSIFVSAIYDLINRYKNTKDELCLEDVLELVMPIGWLTTGSRYYLILKNWESNGLPEGNLSIKIVEELVQMGGLSRGIGPRMQPHQNKPIPLKNLYKNLQYLRTFVKDANLNSNKCLWENYMKELTSNLYGVGNLGTQHLLSILTLLRVLRNPEYVVYTKVLKNTATEKKLTSIYRLTHKSINALYGELANELFDGCLRKMENLGCEFLRDIKHPMKNWNMNTYAADRSIRCGADSIKFPDTFFSTQSIFIEENKSINRYSYSATGLVMSETLPIMELVSDDDRNWDNTSTDVLQIIPSKDKGLQIIPSEDEAESPPRKKRRSKRKKASQKDSDDYATFQSELENYMMKFDPIQESLIWSYFKKAKSLPSESMCFEYTNDWFDGHSLVVNTNSLVKDLTGASTGKKRKSKGNNKKSIIKYTAVKYDENYCYTAYVLGERQRVYLSSKTENPYDKGFVKLDIVPNGKGIDSVAFYHTKENAAMALKIRIFLDPKYSILKHPIIKQSFENGKTLALFEREGNKINFWGLLAMEENTKKLYVPIIDDYKLIFPWRSFEL